MKFLFPFAVMQALAGSPPSVAQGFPPPGQVLSVTGLGNGGAAWTAGFYMTATSPGARFQIVTGEDPAPIFTMKIDVRVIEQLKLGGIYRRAQCVAQPSDTQPEVQLNYPAPTWPDTFFKWIAYDFTAGTKTLEGDVHSPGLLPFSTYSIDIICVPRLG